MVLAIFYPAINSTLATMVAVLDKQSQIAPEEDL